MQVKVLASSSAGNCVHVKTTHFSLLLDAGIPFRKIQEALDFNTQHIKYAFISHAHSDHSKAVYTLLNRGVDIWANEDTKNELGLLSCLKIDDMDGVKVRVFDLKHDIPNSGFLIYEEETCDKLVYIIDSAYSPYKFNGLTHILLEANYSESILQRRVDEGSMLPSLAERIRNTHFSLENVIEFLKANDLSRVKEIHLLHLSDSNSDEELFKETIQKLTGKVVLVGGK